MKKILFLSLFCLSTKVFCAEPPPSPRDGKDAGKEMFLKHLAEQTAARHLRARAEISDLIAARAAEQGFEARRQANFEAGLRPPTIPKTQELSPDDFQAKVDAALQKLDQRPSNLKK